MTGSSSRGMTIDVHAIWPSVGAESHGADA